MHFFWCILPIISPDVKRNDLEKGNRDVANCINMDVLEDLVFCEVAIIIHIHVIIPG